jgi:hypothetical protein
MNHFKGLGDFNKKGNPPFSRKRGKIPGEKEFYRLKGTPCHFHATFRSQEKPRHPISAFSRPAPYPFSDSPCGPFGMIEVFQPEHYILLCRLPTSTLEASYFCRSLILPLC